MFAFMHYDRIEVITLSDLHMQESMVLNIFSKDEPFSILDIRACKGERSIRHSRLFLQADTYTVESIPSNIWLEVEAGPLYKCQPVKKDIEQFFSFNGYVKILDTVDSVAGDQSWSHESWIRAKKGDAWVNQKIARSDA